MSVEVVVSPPVKAKVWALGGESQMQWTIRVRLKSGAVEEFVSSHAPGFYPEGVMTFATVDGRWVTYAIAVLERVDYWAS